jgi:tetratricopeptide (TPR) repeat protein
VRRCQSLCLVPGPVGWRFRQLSLWEVWPDTFVEENNLSQYISTLRKVLGNGSHEQRLIETVPRRGYRFAPGVREWWDESDGLVSATNTKLSLIIKEETEEEDSETGGRGDSETRRHGDAEPRSYENTVSVAASPHRRVAVSLVAAVLVLASLAGAAFWVGGLRSSRGGRNGVTAFRSIAVLPFSTVGKGELEKFLGLGIADAVTNRLSTVEPVVVRPMNAVQKYIDMDRDTNYLKSYPYIPPYIVAAGVDLDIDLVLHGTVERVDERIKVMAQLTSIENRVPLWVERFDEDPNRVFAVQDRIAKRLIRTIAPALTAQGQKLSEGRDTSSIQAHEAYLAGLFLWNKRSADIGRSIAFFQRAIQEDPNYALAYSGLAAAYAMTGEFGHEAEPTAKKALHLDPTLGEAHAVIGFIRMFHQMKLDEAEQQFKRAIELSPNHASAHQWYALCLVAQGRLNEAKARIKQALEIDPNSLVINADYGQVLYFAKEYDRAIEQCRKVIEMDSSFLFAHQYLYQTYIEKGMYREALNEFITEQNLLRTDLAEVEALNKAYESRGIRGFWQAVIHAMKRKSFSATSYNMATHYAYLGKKDEALYWLKLSSERDPFWSVFLTADPAFEDLHAHPRFQELVRHNSLFR